MCVRILAMLLGAVLSFGVSADAGSVAPAQVAHDLSLRVLVDGVQVMAPTLQVVQGRTAYVSVGDAGQDTHTLAVDVEQGRGEGAVDIHTVLWRGGVEHGEKLMASTIGMDAPGWARSAASGEVPRAQLRSAAGVAVEIQLVSHAVSEIPAVASVTGACLDADGLLSGASGAVLSSGCCSARCRDGSGQTLTCCGGTKCCSCGACCAAP